MSKLIAWLKSLYYTPAPAAETQTIKETPVSKLSLAVLVTGQLANGAAFNSVQATVTDDNGVAQSGVAVSFSAVGANFSLDPSTTDANGQVSASLSSSAAGDVTVTATLADGTAATAVVTFTAVPVVDTTTIAQAGVAAAAVATATAAALSPLEEAKAKFEAFFAFVEHGIEVLGQDAEAELVALKDKYL